MGLVELAEGCLRLVKTSWKVVIGWCLGESEALGVDEVCFEVEVAGCGRSDKQVGKAKTEPSSRDLME